MLKGFSIETFLSYFLWLIKGNQSSVPWSSLNLLSLTGLWIPDHPSSLCLTPTHPSSPSSPLCSSASPPLCLYRGWWGSAMAWSICSDVVQRKGPALIYYTCQLNVWRYILTNKSWILYAGSESNSLILISFCVGDCVTEHWVTSAHGDRDCWWRLNMYNSYEKDILYTGKTQDYY